MSQDNNKLKTLNEFGAFDALKRGARSAAKGAGSFMARNVGKLIVKAPKIARTAAIEGGKGVAVETGFEASKDYHEHQKIKDERAALRYERQALKKQRIARQHTNQEPEINESINVQPPVVLVLKRKSIRLFPQGEKIALYRNEKLGVNFAVPYDDTREARGGDTGETIGTIDATTTSEGFKIPKIPLDTVKKFAKSTPDELATILALGTAVGTAYVTNKFVNKARAKLETKNLPKKKVDGEPVYEMVHKSTAKEIIYTRVSPKQYAKFGAKLGIAVGVGKVALDVTKDYLVNRDAEKRRKARAPINVNKTNEGIEAVLPLLARAAPALKSISGNLAIGAGLGAVGKGLEVAAKKKQVQQKATSGIKDAVTEGKLPGSHRGHGTLNHHYHIGKFKIPKGLSKEIMKGAAIALGTVAVQKIFDAGYDTWRDKKEIEIAKKEEEAKAKARAKVAPKKVVVKTISRPHSKTTIRREIQKEGTALRAAKDILHVAFEPRPMINKHVRNGVIATGIGAAAGYALTRKKRDSEKQKEFDKGWKYSKKSGHNHVTSEGIASFAAKPLVRQIGLTIGSDLAVGGVSSALTAHHVNKKNNQKIKAAVSAEFKRRDARAQSVTEATAFESLQHVAKGNYSHIEHADGKKTKVDSFTAGAIMNVHKALQPENRVKLENMVNKDREAFMRVANFAYKQNK